MRIADMPYCCTSAVLGMFGEHGEESEVTVEKIKAMCKTEMETTVDLGGGEMGHTRCIFATTVPAVIPGNIKKLKAAGFKEVDHYPGVQGEVYVLILHV